MIVIIVVMVVLMIVVMIVLLIVVMIVVIVVMTIVIIVVIVIGQVQVEDGDQALQGRPGAVRRDRSLSINIYV